MSPLSIYIYIDGSDSEDIADPLVAELDTWSQSINFPIKVVNYRHERTPDLEPEDFEQWDIGINYEYTSNSQLESIVNFLFKLGLKYERDFALGYYSKKLGISEDLTYFGHESGPPKLKEITPIIENGC